MSEDTLQRTWLVKAATAMQINELAAELGVSPSSVVDRLLGYGLEAARGGKIEFAVRPVRYELVAEG
ncbi:MAG: hypothetical protein WAZ19_12725 [Anaerolineae bacterium]